jgi:hypothetical protein
MQLIQFYQNDQKYKKSILEYLRMNPKRQGQMAAGSKYFFVEPEGLKDMIRTSCCDLLFYLSNV